MRIRRLIQEAFRKTVRQRGRAAGARAAPASRPRSTSRSTAAAAGTAAQGPRLPRDHPGGQPGRTARAGSLPCGFADNLPVAVQLVGVPFSENTLLAIGREFQARTDWHKRHPA